MHLWAEGREKLWFEALFSIGPPWLGRLHPTGFWGCSRILGGFAFYWCLNFSKSGRLPGFSLSQLYILSDQPPTEGGRCEVDAWSKHVISRREAPTQLLGTYNQKIHYSASSYLWDILTEIPDRKYHFLSLLEPIEFTYSLTVVQGKENTMARTTQNAAIFLPSTNHP